MFIRQYAAAGYISRNVKPATYGVIQGSYACLEATNKGRASASIIDEKQQVLLPVLNHSILQECPSKSIKCIHDDNGELR